MTAAGFKFDGLSILKPFNLWCGRAFSFAIQRGRLVTRHHHVQWVFRYSGILQSCKNDKKIIKLTPLNKKWYCMVEFWLREFHTRANLGLSVTSKRYDNFLQLFIPLTGPCSFIRFSRLIMSNRRSC